MQRGTEPMEVTDQVRGYNYALGGDGLGGHPESAWPTGATPERRRQLLLLGMREGGSGRAAPGKPTRRKPSVLAVSSPHPDPTKTKIPLLEPRRSRPPATPPASQHGRGL
ncbi:hypothetical protein ZWY2020_021782 [Hordeum vulgare]|nr:hypothetical protein ZWY2020_021782 [Hordeum vulgare]